jgi:citronellyl-CoA dehydrogenase
MRLTEEHQQLRRTVREFVDKELNPHVDAWEREGAFPAHEVFKKAGKLGLLGVNKPEAYGGMGLDYSYQMVVTEELGSATAARSRWRSACRPTWRRRRSRGGAPTT